MDFLSFCDSLLVCCVLCWVFGEVGVVVCIFFFNFPATIFNPAKRSRQSPGPVPDAHLLRRDASLSWRRPRSSRVVWWAYKNIPSFAQICPLPAQERPGSVGRWGWAGGGLWNVARPLSLHFTLPQRSLVAPASVTHDLDLPDGTSRMEKSTCQFRPQAAKS